MNEHPKEQVTERTYLALEASCMHAWPLLNQSYNHAMRIIFFAADREETSRCKVAAIIQLTKAKTSEYI